ncbi:MAG: PocR ligand-binding domain-containing protein [Planctomycetota bacterium]|nr:PocR ligand-binding domain-containing protein [Planctomycetota bacterium]
MTGKRRPRADQAGGTAADADSCPARFAALLRDIQDLTGLPICVHDLSGFTRVGGKSVLRREQTMHASPFCMYVKSASGGEKACVECDMHRGNALAFRERKPVVRRCHAGLIEALVPVICGSRHLGTIFAGQARPSGEPPPDMRPLAALGLDPGRAGELLSRAQAASWREMEKLGRVLDVVARRTADEYECFELGRVALDERSAPVRAAIQFVRDRLDRPPRLEEAAAVAYLSPSRFSHLFSEMMGVSFREYVLRLRIERAKFLLANTPASVGEIAVRCGFQDPNHFSRIFRRAAGVPPTEFREQATASPRRV